MRLLLLALLIIVSIGSSVGLSIPGGPQALTGINLMDLGFYCTTKTGYCCEYLTNAEDPSDKLRMGVNCKSSLSSAFQSGRKAMNLSSWWILTIVLDTDY